MSNDCVRGKLFLWQGKKRINIRWRISVGWEKNTLVQHTFKIVVYYQFCRQKRKFIINDFSCPRTEPELRIKKCLFSYLKFIKAQGRAFENSQLLDLSKNCIKFSRLVIKN